LGGCYLPSNFKAEIVINREGDFRMSYVREFSDLTILTKLAADDLTVEEEDERVETLFRDLSRDPSFTKIVYIGNAVFEVTYDARGNIYFDKTLTFVRTSDRIVTLAYVEKTKEITMRGGTVPINFRDRLLALGYDMNGELRLTTDAEVIEHNATEVTGDDEQKTYLWVIQNMDDPPPKLIIAADEPGA
jgi:hypothetical protein